MEAPLVIFGTGGSGTRVVAQLVQSAGLDMGWDLNRALDSRAVAAFYDRGLNPYLAASGWVQPPTGFGGALPANGEPEGMAAAFGQVMERHRGSLCSPRWGWKGPRSMYVPPFLHRCFPDLRVIHVVRDGRDMAYSANQNQLRKHGPWVLDEFEQQWAPARQSMRLWAHMNLAAARYAERHLGANAIVIRYEDLCTRGEAARAVTRFAGGPAATSSVEIHPSASIGRYRQHDPAELRQLLAAGAEALRYFGYADPAPSGVTP